MAFVALQQMDLAGGRRVKAGDLVPEAATWENVALWMRQGFVADIADANVNAFLSGLANGEDVSHMAPSIAHFYLRAASEALQAQVPPPAEPLLDTENKTTAAPKPPKGARR